ncbi:hypothetical protein DFJ67_4746 [Asanoa ferruginea]|uniref:Uncharacterized protein n=1 Tax=Asanoa ferruginea TaxID=53367 RepID=A0A3D9ZMY4_9ACTN|nr:hypothetical protein [Asanoa ferruginea]REF98728.1 hypothetical protein DFJ67_4746 [Asanoa ferruginea]
MTVADGRQVAVVSPTRMRRVVAGSRVLASQPVTVSVGGRAVPRVPTCRLVMVALAASRSAVVGDRRVVAVAICPPAAALSFPGARRRSAAVGGQVPLAHPVGRRVRTQRAGPGARKRSAVRDARPHRRALAT